MALITEDLEIPEISRLFPQTRRWHSYLLKPCPSPAAARRHLRRKEPVCVGCHEAEARRVSAYKEKLRRDGKDSLGGRWPKPQTPHQPG